MHSTLLTKKGLGSSFWQPKNSEIMAYPYNGNYSQWYWNLEHSNMLITYGYSTIVIFPH